MIGQIIHIAVTAFLVGVFGWWIRRRTIQQVIGIIESHTKPRVDRHIGAYRPEHGDIIVVELEGHPTHAELDSVRKELNGAFDPARVVVMCGGRVVEFKRQDSVT